MLSLPFNLYTAAQTRELDHIAFQQHGITAATLMERAGAAALSTITTYWPQAQRIQIICGTGNNGGDGFELARQAVKAELHVVVYLIGDKNNFTTDTAAAYEAFIETGKEVQSFHTDTLHSADIIVDAMFGTGLNREIIGVAQTAIEEINSLPTPVLALDIPSGIHADTGVALGAAVKASMTINFIGLNQGLFTGEAPDYCGDICFDSLQVSSAIYNEIAPVARRISLERDAEKLAPRKRTGHKGLYGHLLIIGGDHGMPGAARLAAEAGARVGSGLTSIATRSEHAPSLNITRPELMCYDVESVQDLQPLIKRCNAITIGPGLGQADWGQALFKHAIETNLPLVVDADALNLLSLNPLHHEHWILTPHPGEASRLLNCSSEEVQADRFAAVAALQQQYGGIAILKGAGTLISNGQAPTGLSTFGNPGMGSGGMGDVLAGTIGGLLAQGLTPMDAACLGVTLHGMAADKAATEDGERGLLASDLMPHLRKLANLIY